jgi:hypothetical protein
MNPSFNIIAKLRLEYATKKSIGSIWRNWDSRIKKFCSISIVFKLSLIVDYNLKTSYLETN